MDVLANVAKVAAQAHADYEARNFKRKRSMGEVASNMRAAMLEALTESGVAELIEAVGAFDGMDQDSVPGTPPRVRRLREAYQRVQGGAK